MSKISKAKLLAQLESQLEGQLQTVTRHFQNLDEVLLLLPAGDGGWSIAQCLEHLNSYGRYYLPEIKKALAGADRTAVSKIFTGTWLGRYFTRTMQPGNTAKKYKSPKDHSPSRKLATATVLHEFMEQQELLLNFIRLSAAVDLDRVRIPISISRWIKLRLGDVFQFLLVHNERHLQQALRQLSFIDQRTPKLS